MLSHGSKSEHCVSMNLKSTMIWCYDCDDEVTDSEEADKARQAILAISKARKPAAKEPQSKQQLAVVKGTRGLANIGNTCFLAASMQCLSHTVAFQKSLRHCPPYSSEELQQATAQQRLVVAVRNFFIQQWGDPHDLKTTRRGERGPASPEEVLTCVQRLNSLFHGYQQHDSQEFLRFLLNSMHEELKRPLSGASIISEVFMGKTCSTVTCLKCNKESKCIEDFYDLSLPIPNEPFSPDLIEKILTSSGQLDVTTPAVSTSSWLWSKTKSVLGLSAEPKISITDCLVQFMRTERLSGSDACYCEHCKVKTDCLKRMSLRQLPEVLVVHLKRFRHDWGSSKVGKLVSFPVGSDLDLAPFVEEKVPNASSYRLAGIVQHLGSIGSGHYVAYCRHKTSGQWYLFDDSRVSLISNVASIEQTEAYVLLFQRVPDPNVIKERGLIAASTTSEQGGLLLPRKWIAQVKTMSRIPPLVSSDVVCTHKHPSAACPVHAKTQFVSVTPKYAERVQKKFSLPTPAVCPVSLDPCTQCGSYLVAYNHRLATEHKLVTKADTKDIAQGENWYFIDSAWVSAWRSYLKHGSIADSNKGCSPGPVKTAKLAERVGKSEKLKITTDYIAVNKNVWSVFVTCHGLDGPTITGSVLDLSQASLEVQPQEALVISSEFLSAEEIENIRYEHVEQKRL